MGMSAHRFVRGDQSGMIVTQRASEAAAYVSGKSKFQVTQTLSSIDIQILDEERWDTE